MPTHPTRLAACVILASGAALAAGTEQPSGSTAAPAAASAAGVPSVQSGQRSGPDLARAAAGVLNLQAGDADRMAAAAAERYEAIAGDRAFSGELIVRARPAALRAAADRVAPLTLAKSAFAPEFLLRVPQGMTEGELAGALLATGDYESARPNWTVYPLATVPNDPQFGISWQHTRLQSTLAWDVTTGSSSVIVAVCDSGVRTAHEDLADALVPGYNSATRVAQVDGGQVEDINGHGTFVSGLAAAIGNNARGVTGVGWNFGLMPIRVTNDSGGGASLFALTEGARWAAANGARAVNVSYTGATASGNNAVARDVKDMGALMFWASGNDGASSTNGFLPDLVIVGSTNFNDTKSGFSNYGTALGVTAPGSNVRSTRRSGGYGDGSGTSYASPVAMGVGALIFSANPALSPDDVQDVLYRSADDLGAPGWDPLFGHGRVNSFNAVTMALTYEPRLTLPVSEDFESNAWSDLLATASGAPVLDADADAPQGPGVLSMDAGDSVESVPLAGLQARNQDYALSFSARVEQAEPGEALRVEYLAESGAWTPLFDAPSPGVDTGWIAYEQPLPLDFFWHGVRVRLTADASDAGERWLVDAFDLGPGSGPTAPFADAFDTGRLSPLRWADNAGAEIALDDGDFAMRLPAGATVRTTPVPVVDLFAFEQWAWFFVEGENLAPGDTLSVEQYTPNTGWSPMTTVAAADLGSGPTGVEVQLPFGAIAASDFRLRFTANAASGAFVIDDVNIGTSRLPDIDPGCSAADLAEPYDVLNFFDLSAYLAMFNAQNPDADLAAPFGTFNFFDISAYLAQYNAGCP